jgi:UDP-N-acetyl-2-amino-2-deoxyglucuronate dehydrogenase
MAQVYRVGIIGCGGIAREHARGFRQHPACVLAAGADIQAEHAARLAAEFDIPSTYADYRELLAKERPDIVAICTWPGSHAEITVAAAEAGVRAILCEKPMARSLAEADTMLAACDAYGARLAIGHHHRFVRHNAAARRLIAEGAIGQPTLLRAAPDGGLLNNGTHMIDRMRFLLGDPDTAWVIAQVERRTDRWERAQPIEDCCMGLIAFAGGARGLIESDLPEPECPGATFVHGTEGTLRLDRDGYSLQNGRAAGGGRPGGQPTASPWQPVEAPPEPTQFEELITWIEGRSDHRSTGQHGRATVEIMMAFYESARTRGLVRLPLASGPSPLQQMIDDGTLPVEKPGKYDIRL